MMTKTLASMTGYGRASGSVHKCTFQVEIKSVNSRGLEIRPRLAPGIEALEPMLRKMLTEALSRGAVSVNVTLQRESSGVDVFVNQAALDTVLAALDDLKGKVEAKQPRLDGILALKGVLETREERLAPEQEQDLHKSVLSAMQTAIAALVVSRGEEGLRLKGILLDQIDQIETLTIAAENHPSRTREKILQRLNQQMSDLRQADNGLSEERLHQEAALLATKADIREELDRLSAHVLAARQLLKAGGPIGRKLDFLSQEFNRESNTLCSKSNAVELTAIGLDLKAVVDQMREQIQNVE
jgi:uncharacterized protein (TIGR00255 family)